MMNLPEFTLFNGMIVSDVSAGPKGVSMKVMCYELRDCYQLYVPAERVKGEQLLNIGDTIEIKYKKMYVDNKGQQRMEVINVLKKQEKSK